MCIAPFYLDKKGEVSDSDILIVSMERCHDDVTFTFEQVSKKALLKVVAPQS